MCHTSNFVVLKLPPIPDWLLFVFDGPAPMQRRSLADIIMDKIREKEQGEARMAAGDDEDDDGLPTLPPKVGVCVLAILRLCWGARPSCFFFPRE